MKAKSGHLEERVDFIRHSALKLAERANHQIDVLFHMIDDISTNAKRGR